MESLRVSRSPDVDRECAEVVIPFRNEELGAEGGRNRLRLRWAIRFAEAAGEDYLLTAASVLHFGPCSATFGTGSR